MRGFGWRWWTRAPAPARGPAAWSMAACATWRPAIFAWFWKPTGSGEEPGSASPPTWCGPCPALHRRPALALAPATHSTISSPASAMCGLYCMWASAPCSRPSRCCGSAGSGAARGHDAQCDDARLVVATARSATHHELVANYTSALSLLRADRGRGGRRPHRGTGRPARGPSGRRRGERHRAWADRIRPPAPSGPASSSRPRSPHRGGLPRPPRGHHLPEPDSMAGCSRRRRVARPASGDVRRDGLSAARPQRPLPPQRQTRTSAARGRASVPGHAARPRAGARASTRIVLQGSGGMITVVGGKLTTSPLDREEVVDRGGAR